MTHHRSPVLSKFVLGSRFCPKRSKTSPQLTAGPSHHPPSAQLRRHRLRPLLLEASAAWVRCWPPCRSCERSPFVCSEAQGLAVVRLHLWCCHIDLVLVHH